MVKIVLVLIRDKWLKQYENFSIVILLMDYFSVLISDSEVHHSN